MANIIERENILLNLAPEPREDAIRRCGEQLVKAGCVKPAYIGGMLERDRSFTTAIGNFIAIPHGEKAYKSDILRTGLSVLTYPEPLDWSGQPVYLVIGIAAQGDEHLSILENIVDKLESGDDVLALVRSGDREAIYRLLTGEEA